MKRSNFPGRVNKRREEAIDRGLDPKALSNTVAKLQTNASGNRSKKNRSAMARFKSI
jgi:hypothetical protein